MSIGYVTIGATSTEKALPFYDAVLGAIGYTRAFSNGGWTGYALKGEETPTIFIVDPPHDGNPARAGNGIMIGFKSPSIEAVQAAHAAGLANGGTDEGGPGPRPEDSKTFYGAYLRDPTGNKLSIYTRP